ncbi:HipA domain-containing protein, partial [Leptospira sp. SA-E8]|uniref:HipA domain-containing protein n=1 Tax=Leptospira sp. SA-E8 TaxID=3422259 RepID=UPI003EBA8742
PEVQGQPNPVVQRWRDLLLAEHHALRTLEACGVQAARSRIVDHEEQRFLEVARFDRVGMSGRRALFSLASLEAEFIGDASAPWPMLAARLAQMKLITSQAAADAALLYAFGALIGNTDMHHGNLSFTADDGFPCALAPAYDMLP